MAWLSFCENISTPTFPDAMVGCAFTLTGSLWWHWGQLGIWGVLPTLNHWGGDNLLKSSLMKLIPFLSLKHNLSSTVKWVDVKENRVEVWSRVGRDAELPSDAEVIPPWGWQLRGWQPALCLSFSAATETCTHKRVLNQSQVHCWCLLLWEVRPPLDFPWHPLMSTETALFL